MRHGRRADRKCDQRRPAACAVFGGQIAVAPQIEVALMAFAKTKQKSDLRSDADGASLKVAKGRTSPSVAGDLLEEVAGQSDMD